MNKHTKKIIAGIAGLSMVVAGFGFNPEITLADKCSAENATGMTGYIRPGNISGDIYVNLDSWYDNSPVAAQSGTGGTPETFNMNYQNGILSGRGWHDYLGFIRFEGQQAVVESVQNNPSQWGNWNGLIDISNIKYDQQANRLYTDPMINTSTYTGGGGNADVAVGLGHLDFGQVKLGKNPCNETVDITLNGLSSLFHCSSEKPEIRWSSKNVKDCKIGKGPWPDYLPEGEGVHIGGKAHASKGLGPKTDKLQQEIFTLNCIGKKSRVTVTGTAKMYCADAPVVDVSVTNPSFKEV